MTRKQYRSFKRFQRDAQRYLCEFHIQRMEHALGMPASVGIGCNHFQYGNCNAVCRLRKGC